MVARSPFPFHRTPAQTITIVTEGWQRPMAHNKKTKEGAADRLSVLSPIFPKNRALPRQPPELLFDSKGYEPRA